MPRKTYPSSDCGNPSCCRLRGLVQLGTLHIVKISLGLHAATKTVYGRSLIYLLVPQNELIKTTSTLVYYGGLASGDWIILEYSGPLWLKAEVTSEGERQWKDLVKCHWAVGALNLTEHEAIERRLVAVWFSPWLLINWIYIRPTGG